MRLALLLLNCYMLFMSCLPCADADVVSNAETIAVCDPGCDDQHQESDDCPPGCVCHCCGTRYSSVVASTARSATANIVSAEKFPPYTSRILTATRSSIFQPPRLS